MRHKVAIGAIQGLAVKCCGEWQSALRPLDALFYLDKILPRYG